MASPRGIDPFQTQHPSEGEASGRVVLDEWHDLRHAPKAAAEDLTRHFSRAGRNPSPIHAWPVNLGIGLDTESVHLSLLDPPSKNLAVCGPSMAGHTALLRSLVEGALRNGWQASVVDPKADEYRDLREGPYGERVNGARDGNVSAGPLDQETMRAFIENGITAGTKDQPRLVVIDNGDYLFEPEPGAKRGEGWLVELARLLDHMGYSGLPCYPRVSKLGLRHFVHRRGVDAPTLAAPESPEHLPTKTLIVQAAARSASTTTARVGNSRALVPGVSVALTSPSLARRLGVGTALREDTATPRSQR